MTNQNTDTKNSWIKSTCAYCGVGCGIEAKQEDDGSLSIRGDESHPANYGKLCSKGLALGETVSKEGRLIAPSINGDTVKWPQAIDYVADNLSEIVKKHGPDSVALYVSGQLLTEDYYVANKFIKGAIGSGNIDTNSRLCMSSSVAGHKRAFGSDTVPNCYEDLEKADLVVLIGSNLAWCHPVLYQRLKTAKAENPNCRIVVVDPRATDTCDIADLHLAITPGSDVLLFNGLLAYLAQGNHLNQNYIDAYTEGFEQAIAAAQTDAGSDDSTDVDWLALSRATGLPIAYIETFYQWFAQTEKTLSVYSQGVNQSSAGVDKVNSIINCHLATGRIGREGCGPFSVTGQPNAMGGREVGGLANMLASHMDFGNEAHHNIVSNFWSTDNLATKPGLKAVDLFDAVDSGKIKAIWIMATNPVVSMPNADKVKAALKKCPLVVVSDCIADTDTTRCANVLLPAMGWSEKSGTVTNSERRISRQRQLIASTGQARADWWIISQVALRMNYAGFNFTSAADVFREYAEMTGIENNGSRDLDISALATVSDADYDKLEPQQWPLQTIDTDITQKRFFAEGGFYTPSKKGQLIAVQHRAPMTQVSAQYPMVLNSGRIRDQWHTMTRTGLAPKLGGHKIEPYVQINPQDARCFGLKEGNIAELNSKWGSAKARVQISTDMNPGQVFMPMHWTGVEASAGRVCSLISPDVDPISGQPELKFTPISIKPWAYKQEAIVITKSHIDTSGYDFWVHRTIENGHCYLLASQSEETSLKDTVLASGLFANDGNSITFDNPNTLTYRSAKTYNGELHSACVIAPEVSAADYAWLDSLLSEELSVEIQRSILKGEASAELLTGKQICACKQVGELTIIDAIKNQHCNTAEAVGQCTEAGTGCGSCIPEINQLIEEHGVQLAVVAG